MVMAIFENLMSHVFKYMNNWLKMLSNQCLQSMLFPVKKIFLTFRDFDS